MSAAAQINVNRLNAPANSLEFGLFSTRNCVRPDQTEEYEAIASALWTHLSPSDPLQEMLAAEIIRAAWRLHRCVLVEEELGLSLENESDPMLEAKAAKTQAAVERARAQAYSIQRRAQADLKALQTESWIRTATLPPDCDTSQLGLVSISEVLKARLFAQRHANPAKQAEKPAGQEPEKETHEENNPPGKTEPRRPNPYRSNPEAEDAHAADNPPAATCFCDSGKPFRQCHGNTETHRRYSTQAA